MKKYATLFPILGSLTFTIFSTLLGLTYVSGNSSIYILYNVAVAGCVYLYCFFSFLIKPFRINVPLLVSILAVVYICVSFLLIYFSFNDINERVTNFFSYFIIWSLPAFLFGIVVGHSKLLGEIEKTLDVLMLVLSAVVIVNGVFYFSVGGRTSSSVSGSSNYQTMSYVSALAFALDYYLLTQGNTITRRSFFANNRLYRALCMILLPLQLLSLIVTGGRGGFVLLCVYFIYITLLRSREFTSRRKKITICFCFFFGIGFLLVSSNEALQIGFERITQFIGAEGIDWSGTSNRDIVYSTALKYIKERPVLGWGIFGYLNNMDNPHNIFLELLLGGGAVYFLAACTFLGLLLIKYHYMAKRKPEFRIMFIFFLYGFVMLMFSGTYLVSPELWVFIGVVASYNSYKDRPQPANE